MSLNVQRNMLKYGYFAGGIVSLGLAVIGALLPIMPTTVFLIMALWCFSKSSKRLEYWLLTHPKFGVTLSNWQQHKVVPKKAKYFAVIGMLASVLISGYVLSFGWLQIALAVLFAFICNYLFAKPNNTADQPNLIRQKQGNVLLSVVAVILLGCWSITL
ncbi:YbaN family protein [Pseudoalteromonas sp. P94(2023)]|uniref:YbaN family protein n=2 Tax=Pseudoalteromonas obscura TaxID=3048491 RepID=A0ABT7ERY0_9GAMM|nr:YbaN family protein [Pseudoalteromonas sp. P94(2023)]MDK2597725.1 YbaN family protein [Pseudoalteromonas sp. P94(2023)]